MTLQSIRIYSSVMEIKEGEKSSTWKILNNMQTTNNDYTIRLEDEIKLVWIFTDEIRFSKAMAAAEIFRSDNDNSCTTECCEDVKKMNDDGSLAYSGAVLRDIVYSLKFVEDQVIKNCNYGPNGDGARGVIKCLDALFGAIRYAHQNNMVNWALSADTVAFDMNFKVCFLEPLYTCEPETSAADAASEMTPTEFSPHPGGLSAIKAVHLDNYAMSCIALKWLSMLVLKKDYAAESSQSSSKSCLESIQRMRQYYGAAMRLRDQLSLSQGTVRFENRSDNSTFELTNADLKIKEFDFVISLFCYT